VSKPGLDFLDASHSGYQRLSPPVTHRRRIWFLKDPFAWLVVDSLIGDGEHLAESFLHLAPDGELSRAESAATRRAEIQKTIQDLLTERPVEQPLRAQLDAALAYAHGASQILIVPLNWSSVEVESGWVAPRWGKRVASPVLRFSGRIQPGSLVGYLVLPA
jgi:hypothetical protein